MELGQGMEVATKQSSLLGRNWLLKINFDWHEIKYVSTALGELLQKYRTQKVAVKPDATPKFCRARTAPYSLHDAIEKDLMRLQQLGIIESIKYSDWATPIVSIPKPDGSVRICGGFKVTINPVLQINKLPIPKPEDLLTVLAGGQNSFSIQMLTVWHSITSALAIFQSQMEKILQGIPKAVFDQWGLCLKKAKCKFMQESVQYLGYIVDAQRLHTSPKQSKKLHSLKSTATKSLPGLSKLLR